MQMDTVTKMIDGFIQLVDHQYRGFAKIVKLRKFAAMMEENIRIVRIV